MYNPQRPPRPKLTGTILKYALLDIVGMVLLAIGLAWFAQGPGAFFKTFPSTTGEAIVLTAAGVVLMAHAAARILREVMRQQQRDE